MRALKSALFIMLFTSFSAFAIVDPERMATALKRNNPEAQTKNDELVQAMKNTEQEAQEALKAEYKNFENDKENFAKPKESQSDALTILSKPSH